MQTCWRADSGKAVRNNGRFWIGNLDTSQRDAFVPYNSSDKSTVTIPSTQRPPISCSLPTSSFRVQSYIQLGTMPVTRRRTSTKIIAAWGDLVDNINKPPFPSGQSEFSAVEATTADVPGQHSNPGLLARDIGNRSQGHLAVERGPEIQTGGLSSCQLGLSRRESALTCLAGGLALTKKTRIGLGQLYNPSRSWGRCHGRGPRGCRLAG